MACDTTTNVLRMQHASTSSRYSITQKYIPQLTSIKVSSYLPRYLPRFGFREMSLLENQGAVVAPVVDLAHLLIAGQASLTGLGKSAGVLRRECTGQGGQVAGKSLPATRWKVALRVSGAEFWSQLNILAQLTLQTSSVKPSQPFASAVPLSHIHLILERETPHTHH